MRCASLLSSHCGDDGSKVPEFCACALELGVEPRMLKADRFAVAPSPESAGVDEGHRLDGAQPMSGDVFSFDIDGSFKALKLEPNFPSAPIGTDCAAGHRLNARPNRRSPARRSPGIPGRFGMGHSVAPVLRLAQLPQQSRFGTVTTFIAALRGEGLDDRAHAPCPEPSLGRLVGRFIHALACGRLVITDSGEACRFAGGSPPLTQRNCVGSA